MLCRAAMSFERPRARVCVGKIGCFVRKHRFPPASPQLRLELRSHWKEYYPHAADINTHSSAHLLAQLAVLLYQDALFSRRPLGIL